MLSNIILEVQSIMATIPAIGRVHAYRRNITTEAERNAMFKDEATGMIRAWDITRESTTSSDRTVGGTDDLHTLVIRGFMSISDKDQSDLAFQNLIEAVRAALRVKRNLNGKVIDSTPVQARQVTAATVMGALVHYCELSFQAEEFPLSTT